MWGQSHYYTGGTEKLHREALISGNPAGADSA
jgi:hypothetical protein